MVLSMKPIAIPIALLLAYILLTRQARPEPAERARLLKQCLQTSVCFALDGSDTISEEAYQLEQTLVIEITKRLAKSDMPNKYAAVQYGASNHAVSPLTPSATELQEAVMSTGQCRESGSFVTAGLNYCFGQLIGLKRGTRSIVLLGDGRKTVGSEPADRAALFRRAGGEVLVVAVGDAPDMSGLEAIVGGDSSKLFSVHTNSSLPRIAGRVVETVCGS